ncbi:MAG: P22 phage major capsid protein family protein [Elusimicrobia bacterium]|nr:P22 phage major capsid protein family protein [Elusimicrobiota bacterium]
MSNTLVTCSIISREVLAILKNSNKFMKGVNRTWEDEFAGNQSRGYSPGATINIKKPPRYTYRAGRVAVPQATTETTVPLTVSQGGTDLNFNTVERSLYLQQVEKKIEAAAAAVINEIDRQGMQMAHDNVFNLINSAGTIPATQLAQTQIFTDAGRRLNEMAAPDDANRYMTLNPAMNGAAVSGLAGLFNPGSKISSQYSSGQMLDALGFKISMDQNAVGHTNGAATATNINAVGITGSNITVVAVAAGTLTKGTIITLPGVYAVNPQSRQSTGVLMDFVVTADVAQGATTIPVSPALVTSGPFQNVTASPTNGSPYVIRGAASTAYGTSYAFHEDAFTLAMVPMWTPPGNKGVVDVSQLSEDGFTVKSTTFYDGVNDNYITRLDVLYGWAATYPELAVKVYNV